MNKNIIFFTFFILVQWSFAQVGIGTTTPSASSALEIKSTNSGLLIPRLTLTSSTDATTIASPATSLLVYNTSSVSDVTPGFYYWDTTWKKLSTATTTAADGSNWSLSGNNLSTGNEFLGTNNYYSLFFKVNGSQFAKFHPNGGTAIGINATANDNNSIAIGTSANASASNQATAVGPSATASGFQSAAFGYNSSATNNSSVAIGNTSSSTGYLSFAFGYGSGSSNNNSLALGNSASASGQQASAIGYQTVANAQNATAIGYQANATQSNSIILGSSSNSSNKVGIGTNTPDERLHVVGSVKIVDGTQANGYVLTSDASGKATWKDPTVSKSYGEIYRTSNLTLPSGAINFGTSGVTSNTTLGTDNIQVTTTGLYRVTYTVAVKKTSGSSINVEFYLGIYGTEIPGTRTFVTITNGDTRTVSLTKLVNLNAYQAVLVYSNTSDANTTIIANGSTLMVELIK